MPIALIKFRVSSKVSLSGRNPSDDAFEPTAQAVFNVRFLADAVFWSLSVIVAASARHIVELFLG